MSLTITASNAPLSRTVGTTEAYAFFNAVADLANAEYAIIAPLGNASLTASHLALCAKLKEVATVLLFPNDAVNSTGGPKT